MRQEKTSTFIKSIVDSQTREKAAILGFKLESIISIRADHYTIENKISSLIKSQVDLINSLYNPEEKYAYELRYINRRGENIYPEDRRLEVALLVKVGGKKPAEDAKLLGELLPVILSGRIPEYEFRTIDSAEMLDAFLQPFSLNQVAEIRRRHQMIPVTTLKKEKTAGFFANDGGSPCEQDCVYFVFPFINRMNDFSGFIRMLLGLNQNLMVSCLLIPTVLRPDEINFINKQILKCEQARLTYSGHSQGYGSRASTLVSIYEEQLSSLLDAPYLMQVRVMSDEPISSTLLETLGVEITEYQSNRLQFSRNYYSGGYDIVYPTDDERNKAIEALKYFRTDFFSHPVALGRWRFLFDAAEASTAFRLPLALNDNLVGLPVTYVKPIPLPGEVTELAKYPQGNTRIGFHSWSAASLPVYVSDEDRLRHIYIIGQTGTGKTNLMKNMIVDDLNKGAGVIVIDPHGDLFYEITGLIPEKRRDDVVLLNPADIEYPVGLNLLEWKTKEEKYFLIKEMQEIIKRMMVDEYGEYTANEMMGPVFFHYIEMVLLLLMSHPVRKATIYDFYDFFQSEANKEVWVEAPGNYDDENLKRWVKDELPKIDFQKRGEGTISLGEYVSSKFKDFIFDPKLKAIFSQQKSTINITEIMNNNKVLLINLAKGELSERCSRFLGMVLMSRIMSATMERIKLKKEERRPVYLYVDEFQNIATESFSIMLSEARKFGVGLVLANQFMSQIYRKSTDIIHSILGNVSTWITFRVGLADAERLEDVFLPSIRREDLVNLPNWQAAVRTSVKGKLTTPFYIKTEKSQKPDEKVKEEIIKLSRRKYSIKNKDFELSETSSVKKMSLSEILKMKSEEARRRLEELSREEKEIREKLNKNEKDKN